MEEDAPRIIKRYSNRKLYDTVASTYVTLQDIAGMVRQGEDVRVIDNTSKEDLTHVTFAQIIYEEEKKGDRRSMTSLRNFIQEGRERLIDSLPAPIRRLSNEKGREEDPAQPDAMLSALRAEIATLRVNLESLEQKIEQLSQVSQPKND